MFKELKEIHNNSYSPYSNYKVSSIVIADNNKKYYGVNIENKAFPVTICAERAAIFSAISSGARRIKEVFLLTDSRSDKGTPCGSCRQVMSEFMNSDSLVHVFSIEGVEVTYSLNQLLPYSFDEEIRKDI
jgi:cytidine deaminase